MNVLRSLHDLDAFRASHAPCVLVPTMGALHAGHAALVRQGADLPRQDRAVGPCVATIFVNPTQFNDPADLARYPRTLEADLALCEEAGAAAVFVPAPELVYPPPPAPPVAVPELPPAATDPGLEDAHRPGHFAGVCQVVARLLDLTRPAVMILGEKDFQQLAVLTAMILRQSRWPTRVMPAATIREPDGLAMSSRNRFLTPAERRRAAAVYAALRAAAAEPTTAGAQARMRSVLEDAGLLVEYAVVRDAETLGPPRPGAPCRALVAARLGAVRLIDNAPWPGP